jgi:hypothetical protein
VVIPYSPVHVNVCDQMIVRGIVVDRQSSSVDTQVHRSKAGTKGCEGVALNFSLAEPVCAFGVSCSRLWCSTSHQVSNGGMLCGAQIKSNSMAFDLPKKRPNGVGDC